MKRHAVKIALAAIAVVGMISISSCEKGEENNNPAGNNRLTLGEVGSVWQCSTEHYTITWTLLNDSTIYSEVEKDSGYYAGFGDNMWYNYFIVEKGTDVGWSAESSMFFLTKRWNSNNDTLNIEKPYIYNKLEDTFSIYYTGPTPDKSVDYLFKKIK